MTTAVSEKLTERESMMLAGYENTIREGLSDFIKVGLSLMEIRDRRLYRLSYQSFEDYCQGRWEMTRRHASRLITAAGVIGNINPESAHQGTDDVVGPIGPIPASESVARPLADLPAEEQAPAWKEAVDTAPAGKVTAKHVEKVVAKRKKKRKAAPAADETTNKAAEPEAKDEATEPVTDEVGTVITRPEVIAAFERRSEFTGLASEVSQVKKKLRALSDEPIGAFIEHQRADSDADNLRACIKYATPYAVCAYCKGNGCDACRKQGWLPKQLHDMAPDGGLKR